MAKTLFYLVICLGIIFLFGLSFLLLSPDYDVGAYEGKSMSPAINFGDLIITARPREKIKPGMIITYNQDNDRIIHRVISIENGLLRTKGDSNGNPDQGSIRISNVKGIYLLRISYLGNVTSFMRTPFCWLFLTILLATCLIFRGRQEDKENRENGERRQKVRKLSWIGWLIVVAILIILAAISLGYLAK